MVSSLAYKNCSPFCALVYTFEFFLEMHIMHIMTLLISRTHGVSSGRIDVYYHGPNGQKMKSKGELIKELGDRCSGAWQLSSHI